MATVKHREHGRPRYQKGCQCPECTAAGTTGPCKCTVCTAANRAYKRRNDRLKVLNGGVPVAGGADGAPATSGPRPVTNPDELVEAAIEKELTLLGRNATDKPGLAAAALAMGRLLDDPGSGPQHPAAVGQLRAALKEIRGAQTGAPAGKLTAMKGGRGA